MTGETVPTLCRPATGSLPEYDVVVHSRLTLDRNLAGALFPEALDAAGRESLLAALVPALGAAGLTARRIAELPEDVRQNLAARELVPRSYLLESSHLFAYHDALPLWAVFMQRDHVSLQIRGGGLTLLEQSTGLFEVDEQLNRIAPWAYDAELGYLSSDIERIGPGLTATVLLHLPALELSGYIEIALKQAMDAGFVVGGCYGSAQTPGGSLYEISLPAVYSESEQVALDRLSRAAKTLAAYERRKRNEILADKPWDILDMAGRALGRAKLAWCVGWDECTEIVSGLRLAASCELLDGPGLAEISELWYTVRSGCYAPGKPDYVQRAAALRAFGAGCRFKEG